MSIAGAPLWVRAAEVPPTEEESIQGSPDLQYRLTLDTMIDGRGPYKFVVDTGSDRSVIAAEVAASLGLLNSDDVIVQGISRSLPARTVELRNIAFGRVNIDVLPAPVLPRHWLGADGYLGLDAIDGQCVTFDFRKQRISLGRSIKSEYLIKSDEVIVRANGSHGRLKAVDCSVDHVSSAAFIDSGAEASIGNTALFTELGKGGAIYLGDVNVPLLGATGGQTTGRMISVSNIRMGTLNISRSNLIIADLDVFNVWGLANRPALFLGMNYLKYLAAFSIDYARREMRFKLGSLERLAKNG